jgi:hypothetical protein
MFVWIGNDDFIIKYSSFVRSVDQHRIERKRSVLGEGLMPALPRQFNQDVAMAAPADAPARRIPPYVARIEGSRASASRSPAAMMSA